MGVANYAFRFARESTEKMDLYELNIFIACSLFETVIPTGILNCNEKRKSKLLDVGAADVWAWVPELIKVAHIFENFLERGYFFGSASNSSTDYFEVRVRGS